MIIYTPLAMEDVFPCDETEWKNRKEVAIKNGTITIRRASEDAWEVCALQSSDPQDYLRAEYQPGAEWKNP
ncbi:YlzJ-like family protein [Bacillus piscicola]|uniref:YlzJ-like family protein n=1 Tax=Bacillus piscicola TaxID=1632684 RepID=UPI001F09BB3C|nr:YlzJ-like family protein [Bacillus piscicola]